MRSDAEGLFALTERIALFAIEGAQVLGLDEIEPGIIHALQ